MACDEGVIHIGDGAGTGITPEDEAVFKHAAEIKSGRVRSCNTTFVAKGAGTNSSPLFSVIKAASLKLFFITIPLR
jgi:hypothetical protein